MNISLLNATKRGCGAIAGAAVLLTTMAAHAQAQQLTAGTESIAAQASALLAAQATPAPAQAPAPAPDPPAKIWTIAAGSDFPTAYIFRGIFQEDQGFIAQPFFDFGIAAAPTLSINFGTWNSIHTGPSGSDHPSGDRNAVYETDWYAGLTATAGKVKPGVLYTAYTSPNDAFATVHELALSMTFDDSAMMVPSSPKVLIAFELDGQADGGSEKGVYLELSGKPSVKAGPATLGIPIKVGLSLKDYYEGLFGSETFGFFAIGASISIPLSGMTAGAWEVHGGVDFYRFGDNMAVLNGLDENKAVGNIGFSVVF